jgi:hypothetical protein
LRTCAGLDCWDPLSELQQIRDTILPLRVVSPAAVIQALHAATLTTARHQLNQRGVAAGLAGVGSQFAATAAAAAGTCTHSFRTHARGASSQRRRRGSQQTLEDDGHVIGGGGVRSRGAHAGGTQSRTLSRASRQRTQVVASSLPPPATVQPASQRLRESALLQDDEGDCGATTTAVGCVSEAEVAARAALLLAVVRRRLTDGRTHIVHPR